MADQRSIGVMDSGLGGLSVLHCLQAFLPMENFIFWADNANAPYGDKPSEQIRAAIYALTDQMMQENPKAIVVACNTATSVAIGELRESLPIPVISMEPAIKPALLQTNETVLMLATEATCYQERYLHLKESLDGGHRVLDVPCADWAHYIEKNITVPDAFDSLIENTLFQYAQMKVDGIVLGCTHYPLIEDKIRDYAYSTWGEKVKIFDGRIGTAHQLARILENTYSLAEREKGEYVLRATSNNDSYLILMNELMMSLSERGNDGRKAK